MPTYKPTNICQACRTTFVGSGLYCERCRPSRSGGKSYGNGWKKVRIHVLAMHGIPREQWSLYDVDHNPPYDADIEPDHYKYNLIPRLHAEHSQKTANEDIGRINGRFVKKGNHV